ADDGLGLCASGLGKQADGRSQPDALAVVFGGKDARVGLAVRCQFPSFAAVAVEAVYPGMIKLAAESLADDDEGRIAKVRVARNVADYPAPCHLRDAPLGEPQKAYIQLVEIVFADVPFREQALLVGLDKPLLFFRADSRKGVIGWIAEYDKDGLVALHEFRRVALVLQLWNDLLLGSLGRIPAGERIGEVHANALVKFLRERRAHRLQQKSELKVRDDKGGGQKLESEDALHRGGLHVLGGERVPARRGRED